MVNYSYEIMVFFLIGIGVIVIISCIIKFEKAQEEEARRKAQAQEEEARRKAQAQEEEARRKAQAQEEKAHIKALAEVETRRKAREEEEEEWRKERKTNIEKYGFYELYLHRDDCELYGKNADAEICKMTKGRIIIDTCIWMLPELECFFIQLLHFCELNNSKVTIPAAIYEEVEKLKNKPEKSSDAKTACERLMLFSNKEALEVLGLQKIPNRKAYGDKELISLAKKWTEDGRGDFYFLTNDLGLIFRLENLLPKKELCRIVSVDVTQFSISEEATKFCLRIKANCGNK